MKHTLIAILVAATITLVGVLSFRLSIDALALIAGVLLGIIALVPTLLIGALVLRRVLERQETGQHTARTSAQPPVIVVSGGVPSTWLPPAQQQPASPPALMSQASPQRRKFHVLGFEEDDEIEQDAPWYNYVDAAA